MVFPVRPTMLDMVRISTSSVMEFPLARAAAVMRHELVMPLATAFSVVRSAPAPICGP